MSILIKGMEMPQDGTYSINLHVKEGKATVRKLDNYGLGEFEAVPSVRMSSADLISRQKLQARLDCVDRLQMIVDGQAIEVIPRWNVSKIIENVPSAEPCDNCIHDGEGWDSEACDGCVSAEPEEFEWCHDCKEYDQNAHCCHRWTKVIRNTVEELKAERKGKWELAEDGWYCSACKLYPPFDCDPEEIGIPFCPWCGADMRGEEDD